MDNLGTLCLFGLIFIVALFVLPRLMGAGARSLNSRREIPRYDDPDIRSGGSFGSPSGAGTRRYDSPLIRSRGVFGRPRLRRPGGFFGQRLGGSSSRRVDSPTIRSRGSFGKKD